MRRFGSAGEYCTAATVIILVCVFGFALTAFGAEGDMCQANRDCDTGEHCVAGQCRTRPADPTPAPTPMPGPFPGPPQAQLPHFCCTVNGRWGPFPNPNQSGVPVPPGAQ